MLQVLEAQAHSSNVAESYEYIHNTCYILISGQLVGQFSDL